MLALSLLCEITYSVLSCKLVANFWFFSIFILWKVVNHYKVNVIFQNIEENIKKISFITFFDIEFYEVFINLRSIIDPLKIFYRKLLQHCPTIYIIYIPIFKTWRFFIFVILFHIFLISFCASMNCVTYSSCNSFFNH